MNEALPSYLDDLSEIRRRLDADRLTTTPLDGSIDRIIAALNSFGEVVRYLNTRRSKGAILQLESEADVQDALYLMLRPWILDLTPENPTDRVANTYSIKDFISKTHRCVVEVKFVRTKEHGKSVNSELNDDIENYRYHTHCDHLIFFIYDPNSFVPDSAALQRHLTSPRSYSGKILNCYAVIKP